MKKNVETGNKKVVFIHECLNCGFFWTEIIGIWDTTEEMWNKCPKCGEYDVITVLDR